MDSHHCRFLSFHFSLFKTILLFRKSYGWSWWTSKIVCGPRFKYKNWWGYRMTKQKQLRLVQLLPQNSTMVHVSWASHVPFSLDLHGFAWFMGITCAMCGSYLLHGFAPYKRHILDWQTTCLDLHPSTFLLLSCVNIIWTMYNFSYFHIELYIVA